jgi:hypothetical protein
MKTMALAAALGLVLLPLGCGGSSTSDNTGGKAGTAGTGAQAGSGGSSASGGTGGSSASGGTGGSSASGGTGASAGAGGSATGGSAGAAPDGGTVGIECGSAVCTPGTQMCCVSGNAPVMQCVDPNAPGPSCDFSARCDGAEDCGSGQSCCMPSGGIIQTYCVNGGSCPAGDTLCHTQSDCTKPGELCCYSLSFGWPHSECMNVSACPS